MRCVVIHGAVSYLNRQAAPDQFAAPDAVDECINACSEFLVAAGLAAVRRKKWKSPFGLAMKPSRLMPTKTDAIIVTSVLWWFHLGAPAKNSKTA
jgi:hypothetical protein